jgi:hypothetical protein
MIKEPFNETIETIAEFYGKNLYIHRFSRRIKRADMDVQTEVIEIKDSKDGVVIERQDHLGLNGVEDMLNRYFLSLVRKNMKVKFTITSQ